MDTAKYYTSIADLPLSKFIECQIDKNLSALTIAGFPTQEQLEIAWADIVFSYNDAMTDSEGKVILNLKKEVALLASKLTKIEICIKILESEITFPTIVIPEKRFANDLNKYVDANFSFNHSKPELFKEELKRARNRSKSILINYELKKVNLDLLEKKDGTESKKPTKEYYLGILNELSSMQKYEVQDSIVVYRFCDLVKKYLAQIKYLESQTKKK